MRNSGSIFAAILICATGLHQNAGLCADERPPQSVRYVLESKERQRVAGVLTLEVDCPQVQAEEWFFFAAKAPELPGQINVKTTLAPQGADAKDRSPLARPLSLIRIPANSAGLKTHAQVRVTYEATLVARTLKTLAEETRPPQAFTLTAEERKTFLAAAGDFDFHAAAFQRWLTEKNFLRDSKETEIDFARRVFLGIKSDFSYDYQTAMDRHASAVCRAGKSDCGGLSVLFAAVLRANKLPARTLFGHWAISAKTGEAVGEIPYYQAHVKAEFFAAGVGWVPVDLSSAILHDKSAAGLNYFGIDTGNFVTFHVDPKLMVEAGPFGLQPVHNLQRPAVWIAGKGSVDPMKQTEDWQVQLAATRTDSK